MRVLGQEHLPTDVLVGGAAGWLIGHYVYEKHHVHRGARAVRAKLVSEEMPAHQTSVTSSSRGDRRLRGVHLG
jgi:hypothetical protein